MAGKYVLHPAGSAQFHWDLKSANSQTVLSSQLYATKAAAEVGIESCRANSADDARYSRLTSKGTHPFFLLKAANGETIGTSQMYSSDSARDQGIASCKVHGPEAETQDNSLKSA